VEVASGRWSETDADGSGVWGRVSHGDWMFCFLVISLAEGELGVQRVGERARYRNRKHEILGAI
jgi:hypothetical protein